MARSHARSQYRLWQACRGLRVDLNADVGESYGAWTLGNYVYDHWDDITEFGGKALDWTGDRLDDVADAADAATDWAGDRLADAGNALEAAGRSAVHTVTLGLLEGWRP